MLYVILVKGSNPVAKLIQSVTNSPYSHCGFLIDKYTYEADIGGIKSRCIINYKWQYELYKVKSLTEQEEAQLLSWCRRHLDKRYGYSNVIGSGLRLLLKRYEFIPYIDSREVFHCAQFVYEGLKSIGRELLIPETIVTPGSLGLEPCLEYFKRR